MDRRARARVVLCTCVFEAIRFAHDDFDVVVNALVHRRENLVGLHLLDVEPEGGGRTDRCLRGVFACGAGAEVAAGCAGAQVGRPEQKASGQRQCQRQCQRQGQQSHKVSSQGAAATQISRQG